MIAISFENTLRAKDFVLTGGHMGWILFPRTFAGLITLPSTLNPASYNAIMSHTFKGLNGVKYIRCVYYNNKLHGKGASNEYHFTNLTNYLRSSHTVDDDYRITYHATEEFKI